MVERVQRQIKDALRACAADTAWSSRVPWVLLGLHEAPKEDSGVSSADMVLGAPLQLPGELLMLPEPACSFPEFRPPHTLSYAALADSPLAQLALVCFLYGRRDSCVPPLCQCMWGL